MVFSLHMDRHQLHMPTFHTSTPNLRNKDDNSTTALTRTKAKFTQGGPMDRLERLGHGGHWLVRFDSRNHIMWEILPLRGCSAWSLSHAFVTPASVHMQAHRSCNTCKRHVSAWAHWSDKEMPQSREKAFQMSNPNVKACNSRLDWASISKWEEFQNMKTCKSPTSHNQIHANHKQIII